MAWLEKDPSSGHFKLAFRYGGRKFKRTLKTSVARDAEAIRGGAERTLLRLEQKLLTLPEDADILTFVLSDGQQAEKPSAPRLLTLQSFTELYVAAHAAGAMEAGSLATVAMHLRHVTTTFGKRFPVQSLTTADLQRHVARRQKSKGIRGQTLSRGHHPQGDRKFPSGLELGRPHRSAERPFPQPWAVLPQDRGEAAVPDLGPDRGRR